MKTWKSELYRLIVHLVFTTEDCQKILPEHSAITLPQIFEDLCRDCGASVLECRSGADHVHLAVSYPPDVTLSALIESLKDASSRKLKEAHPELEERCSGRSLWPPSYFAASFGEYPLAFVRQYLGWERSRSSHHLP